MTRRGAHCSLGSYARKALRIGARGVWALFVASCLMAGAIACVQAPAVDTVDPAPKIAVEEDATEAPRSTAPLPKPHANVPQSSNSCPLPCSDGLQVYALDGISITYPRNALIEEVATNHIRLIGPTFTFRMVNGGTLETSSYDFELQVHEGAEGLEAADWARKRILDAWREAKAADQPAGGLPVTEAGVFEYDKVQETWVAGLPATRIEFFAFDSYVWHYYVSYGGSIVEIQHPVNIEGNVPYAKLQDDVHSLILGALRFGHGDDYAGLNDRGAPNDTARSEATGSPTAIPIEGLYNVTTSPEDTRVLFWAMGEGRDIFISHRGAEAESVGEEVMDELFMSAQAGASACSSVNIVPVRWTGPGFLALELECWIAGREPPNQLKVSVLLDVGSGNVQIVQPDP